MQRSLTEAEITERFLALSLECGALRLGVFRLKSGRTSPFFFDIGHFFHSADFFRRLCWLYTAKIISLGLTFDTMFGISYKGIPLVSACSVLLKEQKKVSFSFSFNRKETKTHGEGGGIVGGQPKGRVLVVDDVVTAGTSFRLAYHLLQSVSSVASLSFLVALDREEKATSSDQYSAMRSLYHDLRVPCFALATVTQMLAYLGNKKGYSGIADVVTRYSST